MDSSTQRSALIVAHPGHELRVHRWLEVAKPVVFILTDGSGRTRRSRLGSTIKVLSGAGAKPGAIFGCFTDADIYEMIRRVDVAPFLRVMHELADALSDVDYVVGDALEGFNPSHDVCRFLINGAVSIVRLRTGRELRNFDFLLDGSPEPCEEELGWPAIRMHLDDSAFQRKLAAADRYTELRSEIHNALARYGPRAFATEFLRPIVDVRQGIEQMKQDPPYYEEFGEKQVRAGYYSEVIRYRANVRPLVNALWCQSGLEAPSDETIDSVSSALTGDGRVSSHLTHS